MKQVATFMIFLLLAVPAGMAQENAAVEQPAADQPAVSAESVTDVTEQTSPLDELAWMIGTWVDQEEDTAITTTCSWAHNGKFLARAFKIAVEGQETLEGTQFVGWDPIAGQIRSWTFDSEGGIGQGRWIKDGDRWLVKTSFILASGERASAINVITYVDENTLRWQSIDREVGGEIMPSIPEVTVVRQKTEQTEAEQAEKEVSQ